MWEDQGQGLWITFYGKMADGDFSVTSVPSLFLFLFVFYIISLFLSHTNTPSPTCFVSSLLLQPWPQVPDPNNREARQQRFAHFTELAIISVQEIVDFAKQLPGFLELTREDQIALLKTSTIEVKIQPQPVEKKRIQSLNQRTPSFGFSSFSGEGRSKKPAFQC